MHVARSAPFAALVAAFLLASCAPPSATTTSTATQTATTTAAAPVASFTIGALTDADGNIQGCTRSLSRVGAAPGEGDVFREDGTDSAAKGYIRIDGALVAVTLQSEDFAEKGGTRTFADTANTTQIVETLTTGEMHEESDSVDESGTLAVTHNGATQTLQVSGGVAC